MAFDTRNDLYFADAGNNRIRKVNMPYYLGINNLMEDNSNIVVFPNPSRGVFTIQGNSEKVIGKSEIQVYNVWGQKVFSHYQITKLSNYQIDLSAEPSGVYLYRILQENEVLVGSGKFVIEK